jgi:hypothetical protein
MISAKSIIQRDDFLIGAFNSVPNEVLPKYESAKQTHIYQAGPYVQVTQAFRIVTMRFGNFPIPCGLYKRAL